MACIILGDTHGRNYWKTIIKLHPEEQIVFVGDYFDTKEGIKPKKQIENFEEILAFKQANSHRVTLLFGNHDFHYLPQAGEKYSGYQYEAVTEIRTCLTRALREKWLQVCCQYQHYLVSHAGLTRAWCRERKIPLRNPVDAVNALLYTNPALLRFNPGPENDNTGDEITQGPLWVRPYSLGLDYLRGFMHIAGHTQQPLIQIKDHYILVDVLSYSPKYLYINDDGTPEVMGF